MQAPTANPRESTQKKGISDRNQIPAKIDGSVHAQYNCDNAATFPAETFPKANGQNAPGRRFGRESAPWIEKLEKSLETCNMKQIATLLLFLTAFSVFAYSQKTKPIDYSQKIKEATPKPLPQAPAAKRQTTDAQDDGLNGRVKSVVEEREGLTGIEKPVGRRTSLFADFDEQGNYLRRVYFEYRGKPYGVTVYGYIDGARASLSSSVSFGDEDRVVPLNAKVKEEVKTKPDPRYEFKYEYKYADGKLVEMQMIRNTGEKGMRYVYSYKRNQREYLAYNDDDELNQKYLYTLDDKGNNIETIAFNVRQAEPAINGKYRYKYQAFDKQGNWTKRTTSEIEIENGRELEKPLAIEYRTITYYP